MQQYCTKNSTIGFTRITLYVMVVKLKSGFERETERERERDRKKGTVGISFC